jgi:hypothetical protein
MPGRLAYPISNHSFSLSTRAASRVLTPSLMHRHEQPDVEMFIVWCTPNIHAHKQFRFSFTSLSAMLRQHGVSWQQILAVLALTSRQQMVLLKLIDTIDRTHASWLQIPAVIALSSCQQIILQGMFDAMDRSQASGRRRFAQWRNTVLAGARSTARLRHGRVRIPHVSRLNMRRLARPRVGRFGQRRENWRSY